MKTTAHIIIYFIVSIALPSCSGLFIDQEKGNTNRNNFELLWQLVDQKYCFFDEKDINWNDIYDKYSPQVTENLTDDELFNVLSNMLNELKDGHVNLVSDFNTSRYWDWYQNYPQNFNDEIVERKYLGKNSRRAGGIYYTVLNNSIGYIRYGSFMDNFSTQNINNVIAYLKNSKGIIIDVRNNTGGFIHLTDTIASRFTKNNVLVGYQRYKLGPGHNDFTDYFERTIQKGGTYQITNIPVFVLTNRMIYSAANDFVGKMKALPHVTIIGDKTGGGAGAPISQELYNGWQVRFSSWPIYDEEKKEIESGIDPDIKLNIDTDLFQDSIDSMIEETIRLINMK